MYSNQSTVDLSPWYKQFWPWVLIALPLISIVAGLSTLYIAVVNKDALVIEKWRKDGKAIHSVNTGLRAASDFGLSGTVKIDNLTGEIFLTLLSQKSAHNISAERVTFHYPETLLLKIVHPTLSARDQYLSLSSTSSHAYRGQLDQLIEGKRSLYLSDVEESWQIKFKMNFPGQQTVDFSARPTASSPASLTP